VGQIIHLKACCNITFNQAKTHAENSCFFRTMQLGQNKVVFDNLGKIAIENAIVKKVESGYGNTALLSKCLLWQA